MFKIYFKWSSLNNASYDYKFKYFSNYGLRFFYERRKRNFESDLVLAMLKRYWFSGCGVRCETDHVAAERVREKIKVENWSIWLTT